MAEVKWIKMATDIFDNRKIKQIESLPDGDAVIVIWMKLLCLAGNINDSGLVYFTKEIPYTDQMLATQFNRPIATIQMAMNTFESFEMIEIIDDMLHISNWEKYQNVEGMEKIREQNRLRKQRQREKQKLLPEVDRDSHVTVTQGHATDIDKNRLDKIRLEEDKEIDNTSKTTTKRFLKPTIEEVKKYCEERKNEIDAEYFINYYEARGWMIGKNKMKDWKAAVRTWERNTKKETATTADPFDLF